MSEVKRSNSDLENIKNLFDDVSKIYDRSRQIFIPCYEDFYKTTTDFIASFIKPKSILDLGAGTGLLSMYYYRHFPHSTYLLVDIADHMLDIAKARFASLTNVQYQVKDYSSDYDFSVDTVISALSIHHLDDDAKSNLFSKIYEHLPEGGVFINYDQFCGTDDNMTDALNKFWYQHLKDSSLTAEEIERWQERRKLDKECSVETEVSMLKSASFDSVECIYRMQKFAVIVARKL